MPRTTLIQLPSSHNDSKVQMKHSSCEMKIWFCNNNKTTVLTCKLSNKCGTQKGTAVLLCLNQQENKIRQTKSETVRLLSDPYRAKSKTRNPIVQQEDRYNLCWSLAKSEMKTSNSFTADYVTAPPLSHSSHWEEGMCHRC